jgi:hypothetical protein
MMMMIPHFSLVAILNMSVSLKFHWEGGFQIVSKIIPGGLWIVCQISLTRTDSRLSLKFRQEGGLQKLQILVPKGLYEDDDNDDDERWLTFSQEQCPSHVRSRQTAFSTRFPDGSSCMICQPISALFGGSWASVQLPFPASSCSRTRTSAQCPTLTNIKMPPPPPQRHSYALQSHFRSSDSLRIKCRRETCKTKENPQSFQRRKIHNLSVLERTLSWMRWNCRQILPHDDWRVRMLLSQRTRRKLDRLVRKLLKQIRTKFS